MYRRKPPLFEELLHAELPRGRAVGMVQEDTRENHSTGRLIPFVIVNPAVANLAAGRIIVSTPAVVVRILASTLVAMIHGLLHLIPV
jgi:hypothetical protein